MKMSDSPSVSRCLPGQISSRILTNLAYAYPCSYCVPASILSEVYGREGSLQRGAVGC